MGAGKRVVELGIELPALPMNASVGMEAIFEVRDSA